MNSLFYSLDHLYQLTGIPIRCLDKAGEVQLFNKGYASGLDPFFHPSLKQSGFDSVDRKTKPFLINDDAFVYAGLYDPTECVTILGPVATRLVSGDEQTAYAESHGIRVKGFHITDKGMDILNSTMCLLYLMRYRQVIQEDALYKTEDEPQAFNSLSIVNGYAAAEPEAARMSHEYERIYFQQIEMGDVDAFRRQHENASLVNAEHIGKMAVTKSKHFEYMLCASITLSTRAAISGGLDPITAYALSDIFLQRLEKCRADKS